MSESLLSVGLDVGTTSTQLVVSKLKVENRAAGFAVPQMQITSREIVYKSPVHFTPLLGQSQVDGAGIRQLVTQEYAKAGITREQVDTGAIIITGETSRKENAKTVLDALSEYAGEFVVATAGPDLESVLAAKGAGADSFSQEKGKRVLHMDIGGGTSNLALIEEGKIVKTGCLNVGGRLLKVSPQGEITYKSPVLQELCKLKVGDRADPSALEELAQTLVQALEMAAGLRPAGELLAQLTTQETQIFVPDAPGAVISFSGGVADCIEKVHEPFAFGDIGPLLGQAIRRSRLCRGEYRLGSETIRATVIGAGCHSTQLSGSTVFYQNVCLPLKNLPVLVFSRQEEQNLPRAIGQKLRAAEEDMAVLALYGAEPPDYASVSALAQQIAQGLAGRPAIICLQADMAKALGHALALRLGSAASILCIDRVRLQEQSYLDIGVPVGPALPVVIKTLILSR